MEKEEGLKGEKGAVRVSLVGVETTYPDVLHWLDKLVRVFVSGLSIAASYGLLAMMLIVSADVVGRRLNHPLVGAYEITEMLMAVIVFFGLSLAQRHGSHIRASVIVQRFSPKVQGLMDILALTIFLLAGLALTWQSFDYFLASLAIDERTTGLLSIPLYPALLAVPVGLAVLCLQLLLELVRQSVAGKSRWSSD